MGDRASEARHLYNLGDLIFSSHPDLAIPELRFRVYAEAHQHLERAHELVDSESDARLAIFIYAGLGNVAAKQRDFGTSLQNLIAGMELSIRNDYPLGHALMLFIFSQAFLDLQIYELALTFAKGAESITDRIGFVPGKDALQIRQMVIDESRNHLESIQANECEKRGMTMSPKDFLALAMRQASQEGYAPTT